MKSLLLVTVLCVCCGCNVYRQKTFDNCLENLGKQIVLKCSGQSEYNIIRSALVDSMNIWGEMGLRYTSKTKEKLTEIDSVVIFNNSKTKALLFSIGLGDDRVKMITGEMKNGKWNFIYVGLPTFVFGKEISSEKKVMYYTLKRLAEDGMINKWTCELKDDYINTKWFSNSLYEQHLRYLQNKY